MHFPGEGTIYLGQELKFLAPVFVGDKIKVKVEIIEKKNNKKILKLKNICQNQKDEMVIDGSAIVRFNG